MALPASLRRVMLALFVLMATAMMFFYWNQGEMRPTSMTPNYSRHTVEKHINPIETSWTYKCVTDKCVREHYLKSDNHNEKRIPFATCAMTCGSSIILPEPTIKSSVGTRSVTFGLDTVNTRIISHHPQVKQLFGEAFFIFIHDLNLLDEDPATAETASTARASSNEESKNNNNRANRQAGDQGADGSISNNIVNSNKCKVKSCDIDRFNIKVTIEKSDEIYLSLESDEGYNLTIEHDKASRSLAVNIEARSFFGARHGLASLHQLIWFDNEDNLFRVISQAVIKDAPKFQYRGLMLDTSRHYFSVSSIKRTLVGMAHSKLNRFHWHITDSQSFPFSSKYYPQLAEHGAYSSREVYTAEDVKEIVDFARVRGIQVVPEIDAPAHAGNGWDWGPKYGLGELSLCINQQPWNFYCGEPPCGQLNPKNNNTFLVLQKLFTELLDIAGPTDFYHLGGDEVNLECWGQHFNDTDLRGLWCDFMLQAYNRLKIANKGNAPKYSIVWSSGLTATPCLSKNNFVVQLWGGSTWQENYDLIDNGYNVIISHVDAWYLDCGFGSWRSLGEGACSPYRTWQNIYKHRPWHRMRLNKTQMKQVLGGEACLWTEQVDEATLDARLWPRTAALAERLWTDPNDETDFDVVNKNVFRRMSIFRNRLVGLGLNAEAIFPKYCAQNQDECV